MRSDWRVNRLEWMMKNLFLILPQIGCVEWIGLRTGRRGPISDVDHAEIDLACGLVGDRFAGKEGGKRMVTLIQAEHIETLAKFLGQEAIDPMSLRRNIVVSGINLLALKAPGRELNFQIGTAVLKMTGNCHPCSRMEENLGPGGYNAMRGLGGITASIVEGGLIRIGDQVSLIAEDRG